VFYHQCLSGLPISLLPCECLLWIDFDNLPSSILSRCATSVYLAVYTVRRLCNFLAVDCLSFSFVCVKEQVSLPRSRVGTTSTVQAVCCFLLGCLLKSFVTFPHMSVI
jgi:hypothetical protein